MKPYERTRFAHWVPLPAPGPPRTKRTVTLLGENVGVGLLGAGSWGEVGGGMSRVEGQLY